MSKVDLIIIGAGPGGYRAAEYAAKQGLKVVIFEGSEVALSVYRFPLCRVMTNAG